jgi:hypothetical protein
VMLFGSFCLSTINHKLLSLVSKTNKADHATESSSVVPPSKNLEVFGQGLLALFESRSEGETPYAKVAKLISLIEKVQTHGTIVQRSHDVVVELLNDRGDAKVCFSYDIANFGQQTLLSRAHRFWFTTSHSGIEFSAYSDKGITLKLEKLETSAHSSEVKIELPTPLEPTDTFKYHVQFFVREGFLPSDFYDIGTRSITNRISFTLISPPGSRFDTKKVTQESADGFTSDTPPLVSLSLEDDREKLFWQHRKPKPGDQFRTSWSFRERE